jgi:activator of 2-hydroxyglutaryl-CoA dehydratase/predicted nucleotide-binding protein (sugar kinase/HSP70/actin superfamily)
MTEKIIIDAGIEHIRIRLYNSDNTRIENFSISSNGDLRQAFSSPDSGLPQLLPAKPDAPPVFITGKLAEVVLDIIGRGTIILSASALWAATMAMAGNGENKNKKGSRAFIDLSASGYLVIGVNQKGELKDDMLVVNPRCGAGSGANIDRVLQKLAISREEVDFVLSDYLGESGQEKRSALAVRADRCGVFSSSATISDKNQGIPLDYALAVTLKSEVLKCCRKLSGDFDTVHLTGGVFAWRFNRDCATDYLHQQGVKKVRYDADYSPLLDGVNHLVEQVGSEKFFKPGKELKKIPTLLEFPAFTTLKKTFTADNFFLRLKSEPTTTWIAGELEDREIFIALDVGSTMAKVEIADADSEESLFFGAYSNHGDTIETIKHIFIDLQSKGVTRLNVVQVGITGSARYQVQEALRRIYPLLEHRVMVLVENYAHARGSIDLAKNHINHLKKQGIKNINENFFVLVDIGGEDTKLSTISLHKGELFDNAMNIKCSAGTGSLMDSLCSLFAIDDISKACEQAYQAKRAYAINATCAVFLMENGRKLQAQGVPRDEILASANWAIVENMARSLWSQVELPENCVVLLHGQTMLSDPLPLAVTVRLQEYTNSNSYCLVPPHPGHRACRGLVKTMAATRILGGESCNLDVFIKQTFQKKVIQCRGGACGDKQARCNRTSLSGVDLSGNRFNFTLGGCTAINELMAGRKKENKEQLDKLIQGQTEKKRKPSTDTYKEIWQFIDGCQPRTDNPNRLVIPRCFSVSEWAFFFARFFHCLSVPVHVDNVQAEDLIDAQPFFNIDTCAPQIGAVGHLRRLANEPHGIILAPQIEYLNTGDTSLGRTCTINQGGIMVAKTVAETAYPESKFHLFNIDLKQLDPVSIASQLWLRLQPVFAHYKINPDMKEVISAAGQAMTDHLDLKRQAADMAADIMEEAVNEGRPVAVVLAREYILNPGIYDSHVGRLLRDKNIVALPAYLFDLDLDPDYSHMYWRNPHFILTVIAAIANRCLYKRLRHPRLKELFRIIETKTPETLIPVVQVSTFRCGPDTVIAPIAAEIMKKRPFLLIQSDAVVKELAHLENRMNTYIKQLESGLHGELVGTDGEQFSIEILANFSNSQKLDKEKDAIYFPTLADNRTITSVMRGAGFTCFDIYKDESYDLEELIKEGRKVAGDSVCAPLAGVYGDILRAVDDFTSRKDSNDPMVAGKERILIFNNKGVGPCRQGQYSEVHKLFAYQKFGAKTTRDDGGCKGPAESFLFQFMVAEEKAGFDIGLEEWVMIRMFQGVILQGLFQSMLFEAGSRCVDYAEYKQLAREHLEMKKNIYQFLEKEIEPGKVDLFFARHFGKLSGAGVVVKYFAYRLHERGLQRELKKFSKKWIQSDNRQDTKKLIKIQIEGEAYMRVAQSEEIFRLLLTTLGFQRFSLHCTPIWCYLDYLLEEKILSAATKVELIDSKHSGQETKNDGKIKKELRALNKIITASKRGQQLLRMVLAAPLYRAAAITLPESMNIVLEEAKVVMPTLVPPGELGSYVGEALIKLRERYDLFLNVAPEGCMVSSMGEVLTPGIQQQAGGKGRLQGLFSADGEINEELLTVALLKVMGPEKYYRAG